MIKNPKTSLEIFGFSISRLNRTFRLAFYSRASVLRRSAEAGFDGEQAVVFRKSFTSARRARFDERRGEGYGEIGKSAVLGLARAVGHNGHIPRCRRHFADADGFRKCADLIRLDEHGVCRPLFDSALHAFGIRDEKVVAIAVDS